MPDRLRNVDLLVLVLVEVPLDKLLKVAEAHLPRLAFLHLHLLKPALSETVSDMLFKSVVEERTTTQTASPDGRLLDPKWLQRYYLVSN